MPACTHRHLSALAICFLLCACSVSPRSGKDFSFTETTIDNIHAAIESGLVDCETITGGFLDRIDRYDQTSGLNAIVYVNPDALARARALDRKYQSTQTLQPLHCIPVILKDNFDTADMPTTAGSIALSGSMPPDDAFLVRQLRQADAIILAKSNMGEWAFSPQRTISSTHGETLNAYDLSRVPAGSSGGTASAIAANFGVIGMGTDTGNSIRGPASHLALVGIRPTIGVTSRDGIIPLFLNRDVGGPLMRTVEDTARVFNVIAAFDPDDPVTQAYQSHEVEDYSANLTRDGLSGARLGVLRQIYDADSADPRVLEVFTRAIADLEASGAVIVDPVSIPRFDELTGASRFCNRFRFDINNYLKSLGETARFKTLAQIVEAGKFGEGIEGSLNWALSVAADSPADQHPPCVGVAGDPRRQNLLSAVVAAMERLNLDALIYPSWSNPPRKIGDSKSPHGNNSPVIAPHTGQPAITVPMGYVDNNLPLGLQMLGRPFSEAQLLRYAYAYEQATRHRKPPARFP